MEKINEIDAIYSSLADGDLRAAIDALESFGYKYPELRLSSPLELVRTNYVLMVDYWQRGVKDASLKSVYADLIAQTYRLAADAYLRYIVSHNAFLSALYERSHINGRDDSFLSSAQEVLEGIVSNLAMAELESPQKRELQRKDLFEKRVLFMDSLFDYILTSGQWGDGIAETMKPLLLSPTVDSMDQQTIVSALTLSAMNVFDVRKLRLLIAVYRESDDEAVRQRALVGWVFILWKCDSRIFPHVRSLVSDLVSDEHVRSELVELQIQLLYCMNAENDNRTIQQEIMPDIMRHNNLHVTSRGIEEREDDPMQDILDSEASERSMEKLENSFQKMMDMQKAGSDIYFGGFSQMKRFPFFDTVSNWFTPYYPEHPLISSMYTNPDDRFIVDGMISKVAFCNSDKYSFVIAFQKVVDKLPANLREMLRNNTVPMSPLGEGSDIDKTTPAYIRRIYLQDCYRFFRLFHTRSCFINPFELYGDDGQAPGYVFFANPLFCATALERSLNEVVVCFWKRRQWADVVYVLNNYRDEAREYQYYMVCGNILLHHAGIALQHGLKETEATDCFQKALQLRPGDEKATFGYARALFSVGRYEEAARCYSDLMNEAPDRKNFTLGYCVCLTNLERYEEALALLYKLNYENHEDETVKRVLARSLVGSGKYEQALKLYEVLGSEAEDIVNLGYCEWFMGNVKSAIEHFAQYVSLRYPTDDAETKRRRSKTDVIDSEYGFILAHGISDTEIHLMVDAIRDAILR